MKHIEILKKIKDLNIFKTKVENELKISPNTKYSTVNGLKEFTSKSGYTDNLYIPGETLVNELIPEDSVVSGGIWGFVYNKRLLVKDSLYTFINYNTLPVRIEFKNNSNLLKTTIIPPNGKILDIPNVTFNECVIAIWQSEGWIVNEQNIKIAATSVMAIQGDHTNKPLTYFEGLKSIGQDDNIELISSIDNLFNKSEFVIGSTNSIKGQKFIIDSKTNRITHNIKINLKPYEYLEFDYDRSKFKCCLYEVDDNDIILQDYTWAKHKGIRCLNPAVKGVRIIFAYDDNRDMTLSDFDKIRPIITRKYDKKTLSHTLRSLPNGVKDEIYQVGDRYFKVQRCSEILLTGNEVWAWVNDTTNTHRYKLTKHGNAYKPLEITCNSDRFNTQPNISWNEDREQIDMDAANINIRINKTRLSDQSIDGFKNWLKEHHTTVVYELENPIITEIPNPNLKTFEGQNTLLLNSGSVQGDVDFEVTNSLGSALDVMSGKISALDEECVEEFDIQCLNGWSKVGGTFKFSNNTVSINCQLKHGMNDNGVIIFKIPKKYAPNSTIEFSNFNLRSNSTGVIAILDTGNVIIDARASDIDPNWTGICITYII